jgi:hypothetical protein
LIYDLRTNMHFTLKTNPLKPSTFTLRFAAGRLGSETLQRRVRHNTS